MIALNETFERDYTCEQLHELPDVRLPRYYYPGATPVGGRDGLIVHVCPRSSNSWVGIFGFGDLFSKGKNGLFSWPDPRKLCVVARAQGYVVRVDEPVSYEIIDVHPIVEVIPIRSRGLIVFANYTELVAYANPGIVWVSSRLSWDGFTVTAVTEDYIEGSSWDPSVERAVEFKVDLRNGHREGGARTIP